LWTFFDLPDVECIKAFKGGRQICLNIQLRKERANSGGKKRNQPKFNTCLQPFLVFVFVAQNEILHAMGQVYHWALFLPLLIFRSIFINQWFQQLL